MSSVRRGKTQHIARAIEREIGRHELIKFRNYYDRIKNPRTNTLTTIELKKHLLRIPGLPLSEEELMHIIIQVDLDGNGVIDANEFVIIVYHSNLDSFLWRSNREKYSPLRDAKTCRDKLAITLNDSTSSGWATFVAVVVFLFIGLSSVCFCFQTLLVVRGCMECQTAFDVVEYVSTAVFTVEIVSRLVIAKSAKAVFTDLLLYCDVLAVLPVFVELILLHGLHIDQDEVDENAFLNAMRVLRLFRLLKLSRYVAFMRTIGSTFSKSVVPFAMTFFIVVLYSFIAASLVFFFERGTWSAQYRMWVDTNGGKGDFNSIIDWVFFVFYAILTVGYGQGSVLGFAGQALGCITAMFGTIVLAVPISIFSSNFNGENHITEAEQIVAFDRETKRVLAQVQEMEKNQAVLPTETAVGAAGQDFTNQSLRVPVDSEEQEQEHEQAEATANAEAEKLTQADLHVPVFAGGLYGDNLQRSLRSLLSESSVKRLMRALSERDDDNMEEDTAYSFQCTSDAGAAGVSADSHTSEITSTDELVEVVDVEQGDMATTSVASTRPSGSESGSGSGSGSGSAGYVPGVSVIEQRQRQERRWSSSRRDLLSSASMKACEVWNGHQNRNENKTKPRLRRSRSANSRLEADPVVGAAKGENEPPRLLTSTSSFHKTKSGSLFILSPHSEETKLAHRQPRRSFVRSQSFAGSPTASPLVSPRLQKQQKVMQTIAAAANTLVGVGGGATSPTHHNETLSEFRTAKERKRLRSFTTSGTVTDIVAQMELEEEDPIIKQISDLVRKHEKELKLAIKARHEHFVSGVRSEISNVLRGVFSKFTPSSPPPSGKRGQRLITLSPKSDTQSPRSPGVHTSSIDPARVRFAPSITAK